MHKISFVVFSILVMTLNLYSVQKPFLAVLDFEPKMGVSSDLSDFVSEKIRVELFKNGQYKIVERKDMEKLLEEQKLELSGLTGQQYASKIGKLLSAQKILLGTISKLDHSYFINARIVDVETGLMEQGASEEADSQAGISEASMRLVSGLLKNKHSSRYTEQYKVDETEQNNTVEFDIPNVPEIGSFIQSTVQYFLNKVKVPHVIIRTSSNASESESVSVQSATSSKSQNSELTQNSSLSIILEKNVSSVSTDSIDAYVDEVKENRDEELKFKKKEVKIENKKASKKSKLKKKAKVKVTGMEE